MADVMPDYEVEIMKLDVQLDTLRLNMKRNRLEELELKSRIKIVLKNREALETAISDGEEKLASLEETVEIQGE